MDTFVKSIYIDKVRHLNNITIDLSSDTRKHLILTGKNGSGKTSLIEAIKSYLTMYEDNKTYEELVKPILCKKDIQLSQNSNGNKLPEIDREPSLALDVFNQYTQGIKLDFDNEANILKKYRSGNFIFACYGANRFYNPTNVKHIEKIELKEVYNILDKPGDDFIKYLVDLKTTQALAETSNKKEKANQIKDWFENFEKLLKDLFDDQNLTLDFDIDTFQFNIHISNREPFSFSQMSSGYSAIFEIISDLILRMEKNSSAFYNLEGVVLIDEIDTHLHLELQKNIFPFLTEFFPNIQFIVTTHSPFILNSSDNVVIYDLESRIEIKDGLKNLPYSGVVEGYFEVDSLSKELKCKFETYKELASKEILSDADYALTAELEMYLDEIPDYLALDVACEYNRLKLELENRG